MTFPQILLIIAVAALAIFAAFLNTPHGKGWVGETRVKWVIKKTKPGERYVINNLMLQPEEGKTSQIDHVLINRKGIFVIETKNYAGRIYGKESQQEWTQTLNYGKVKHKLYNPIKQNKTHIYHVSNALSEAHRITSAVVFVQGNVQYIEAPGVYSLSGLKKLIKKGKNTLTEAQMERAYNDLTNANASVRTSEHIRNIQAMQKGITNNVCPRCGRVLVRRKGKGADFLGCEGYPACRFTKPIN